MKQSQIIENSQKICYPKEKLKAPDADICILKSHEKRKYTNTKNTYTGDILKRQEAIIMMTEDRYTAILDALKERKSMTVAEFTEITGASESTIRRDLIALDDMGKIKRFHGGAKAIEHEYITNEAPVSAKAQLNVEEKSAIAKYAATMINDEDFIFIDAGTSTELMIDYIGETNATFVTNGIAHAKRLLKKNLRTYMIGGLVKPITEAIIGAEAVNSMKKFNFTKCFLGTNGIHMDYGFTTVDVEEAMVKMEAVNRSYASIVLADSSKFDKVTAVTFAAIEKACIITDRLVNDKYIDAIVVKEVLR